VSGRSEGEAWVGLRASEQLEKERRRIYGCVFVDVGALFQAARGHSQNACVQIKVRPAGEM